MNYKKVTKKFVKGTIGGGMTAISTLVVIGQPIEVRALLAAFAAGSFHGGYQVLKELGWLK